MLSVSKLKVEAKKKLKKKWVDAAAFEILWLAIAWLLGEGVNVTAKLGLTFGMAPFYRDSGMMVLLMFLATIGFFGLIILANGPLHYIEALYYTRLANGKKADLSVFYHWGEHFARNLAVTVYQAIFTIIITFVLSVIVSMVSGIGRASTPQEQLMLCSVVLGIFIAVWFIVSLYFSQVWFIMVDQQKMDSWEAIKRSALLMCHHEGSFLVLLVSFIGWALLTGLTYGLGTLFLMPYVMTSRALFYQQIRPNLVTTIKDATGSASARARKKIRAASKKIKR